MEDTNNTTQLTISEDLILVNQEVSSKEDIIRKLGGLLFEHGFVKDTYTQAVLDREIVYPTGLSARVTGVAVPHTDTEHVNNSAVAVATLRDPIIFNGMGAPKTEVNVYVVMMLAIHDKTQVINILRKVILIIEKDEVLQKIWDAKDASTIKQVMEEHIQSVSIK
jgi:PTS system galactitol-specific IIA component